MKAMVLDRCCDLAVERFPLRLLELPDPVPGESEVLVRVAACGVCHSIWKGPTKRSWSSKRGRSAEPRSCG